MLPQNLLCMCFVYHKESKNTGILVTSKFLYPQDFCLKYEMRHTGPSFLIQHFVRKEFKDTCPNHTQH